MKVVWLWLQSLFLVWSFVRGAEHHCMHDLQYARFKESVDLDSLMTHQPLEARRLDNSNGSSIVFESIRISFDLSKLTSDSGYLCTSVGTVVNRDGSQYTCIANDVLTAAKKDFLVSALLPAVRNYFTKVLSVQRVQGSLVISGLTCDSTESWSCCSNVIPSYLKTRGIADTDFIIHVTARPTSGSVLAWALPCNTDQYGRPISGQANFGPNRIDISEKSRSSQIGVAIHELTHALGFSQSLFPTFRYPLNGAVRGINNVISQNYERNVVTTKMITPNVVKQVKAQFNCVNNWNNAGAELENGADGGSSYGSHWEKRLFHNEYMTATSSYNPVYSAITLALLEDSGWYKADYSTAQVIPWGYLEGCAFITSKCSEWTTGNYFCSKSGDDHCTADLSGKGYCDLTTYSTSIPSGFEYFQNPALGGQDSYADYCPQFVSYSNGDCQGLGYGTTYMDPDKGEIVGSYSKCFQSSLSSSSSGSYGPACYAVFGCSDTGLLVSINNNKVNVTCPMQGGEISVPGYSGKLTCPPANHLCQLLQTSCSGSGILLADGTCTCNPGTTGKDCSLKLCPMDSNSNECSGTNKGTCNRQTGLCNCLPAYTGVSCSQLVCPRVQNDKNTSYCTGHGTCDFTRGQCICDAGYTGQACECVPGCSSTTCIQGNCDCLTGSCICNSGYYGVNCTRAGVPTTTRIEIDAAPIAGFVQNKEYVFYSLRLNSSSYDVTIVLTTNSSNGDADLYGAFQDAYPTAGTSKAIAFISNSPTVMDAIQLCGSSGLFPRSINDTYRFCMQPTSQFIQNTPGVLYFSVLGYKSTNYTISVQSDKCKDVNCSMHGDCGKNFPGICSCDRFWSGDQCNIPKCHPDCVDLNNCYSNSKSVDITPGLRNVTDCYGNGQCVVVIKSNGDQIPTCVCDEAYSYDPITATFEQQMCKIPIPSIDYIEHFNNPFEIHAETDDMLIDIHSWSIFTINVLSNAIALYVTMEILSSHSDAMLFVRKNKLPTFVTSKQLFSESVMQYMDTANWIDMRKIRHVSLLTRQNQLSTGVYYIGIFNSFYARNKLSYGLYVKLAYINDTNCDALGAVCGVHGNCTINSTTLCTCTRGYDGEFCEIPVASASLTLSNNFNYTSSNNNGDSTDNSDSTDSNNEDGSTYNIPYNSVVYERTQQRVLLEGSAEYYTFDIIDTNVVYIGFKLVKLNGPDSSLYNPCVPLLLVNGPDKSGYPKLDGTSKFDFQHLRNSSVQEAILPVTVACHGVDCYKVGVFNRIYSSCVLSYRLQVYFITNTSNSMPIASCDTDTIDANGNSALCRQNGVCIETTKGPRCECKNGWSGINCNSPKSFGIENLWFAAQNMTILCSVCYSKFTLSRGEIKIYMISQSMQPNTGIELRIQASSSDSPVFPSIYVSEILPRSFYDFTAISFANTAGETIRLTTLPLSGHFYVAIYSEAPTSSLNTLQSQNSSTNVTITSRSRRLDTSTTLLDNSNVLTVFTIQSTIIPTNVTSQNKNLITKETFWNVVGKWLTITTMGIIVLTILILVLVLVICYAIWRILYSPDHREFQNESFDEFQHDIHINDMDEAEIDNENDNGTTIVLHSEIEITPVQLDSIHNDNTITNTTHDIALNSASTRIPAPNEVEEIENANSPLNLSPLSDREILASKMEVDAHLPINLSPLSDQDIVPVLEPVDDVSPSHDQAII